MQVIAPPTKTNPRAAEWAIDDAVIQLREWGTGAAHPLPSLPIDECMLGAAELCSLRIDDPTQQVSRHHAQLVRDRGKWLLRDLGSKNGVRVDGARRSEFTLEPGIEVGVGGVTLIAESAGSIELRRFLARLLGWGSPEIVDLALRTVRMAAAHLTTLVLSGEGDLVPTASSLHRRARGVDRPFVVCDPRRQHGDASVRAPQNHVSGLTALAVAAGGTLCVRDRRLPRDFGQVLEALRSPKVQVQLIVCAEAIKGCERYGVAPIEIPSLSSREGEIGQIIDEYAADAIVELAAPRTPFSALDHQWVRQHASTSLPEIEKATLRLVALRASRSLSHAAARLGMAPVSLARWIDRRGLPRDILQ